MQMVKVIKTIMLLNNNINLSLFKCNSKSKRQIKILITLIKTLKRSWIKNIYSESLNGLENKFQHKKP